MRRRLLAAALAIGLLLSGGCASMLTRDYAAVTPHSATPAADGDPSVLRVERYQELVNALIYLVSFSRPTGDVRLYMDAETVEDSLEAACLEVVQEDPLGAYAVDFITYSVTPAVACYEADIQITYRRTPEQVSSVVAATGATAIRGELRKALAAFAPELVLRISYFEGDEAYIRTLVEEAYYAEPACALGMPTVEVSIYPDSGRQRIVELALGYPLSAAELERRREELGQEVERLALILTPGKGDEELLEMARQIRTLGDYRPESGSTAYHALLDGGADSQGLALAMALLCQRLEGSARVVKGTRGGEEHFWNVVQTDAGWQHMDLSQWGEDAAVFHSDGELTALGYEWDREAVPTCPDRLTGGERPG